MRLSGILRHAIAVAGMLAAASAVAPSAARAQTAPTEGDYLYRVTLLRAAPGSYTDLRSAIGESFAVDETAGDRPPFFVRHSQGDHWDFMLIAPMGDFPSYYSPRSVARRSGIQATADARALASRIAALTAYREDWYARSVDADELARRFEGMRLFHIEMFAGLPGQRAELLEQRRMENRYYEHLDRQQNLLFVREAGSNWDAMTIGFHPDMEAFAAGGARFSDEEQDEAARVAGFEDVNQIGPYLRSLLDYHNDTLAVPGQ